MRYRKRFRAVWNFLRINSISRLGIGIAALQADQCGGPETRDMVSPNTAIGTDVPFEPDSYNGTEGQFGRQKTRFSPFVKRSVYRKIEGHSVSW